MGIQSLRLMMRIGTMLGLPVIFGDQQLQVGGLVVPWSDDCAGVAFFAILPLLACWRSWRENSPATLWQTLLLPWLLAAAANGLRVSGILVCRWWLQPAVESLQMHHFLGFVSLLLAVVVILPSSHTRELRVQVLHLAGLLALLTPQLQAPGGWLIALCSMVVLAMRMRRADAISRRFTNVGFTLLWGLAAAWIGFSQMESLWLPWLLVSPFFSRSSMPLCGWLLLPGCLPLIAIQQPWSGIILLPICVVILRCLHWSPKTPDASFSITPSMWRQSFATLAVMLPFAAIGLGKQAVLRQEVPVATLRPQLVAPAQYELHLERQSPQIRVDWIGAQGGGRHHTLPVCMAFRGEHLHTVHDVSAVWTDGKVWRREYFLHEGQLLDRYPAYLKSSFWPTRSSGVHLIFSALSHAMSAQEFAEMTDALAKRVFQHQRELYQTHAKRPLDPALTLDKTQIAETHTQASD